jgi:hypothetical protein
MITKALTWNELADKYDVEHSGRKARTLPMDHVFSWAEKQKDRFVINESEGTIHEKGQP